MCSPTFFFLKNCYFTEISTAFACVQYEWTLTRFQLMWSIQEIPIITFAFGLVTGDEIEVILDDSTDDTPFLLSSKLYNGFNGFKI